MNPLPSGLLGRATRWALGVLCLWIAACSTAHYPINPPLPRVDTATG